MTENARLLQGSVRPALVGCLGTFTDAQGKLCIAEVKDENVEMPWDDDMLDVLYMRWEKLERYHGYIPTSAFTPLPNAKLSHPASKTSTPETNV